MAETAIVLLVASVLVAGTTQVLVSTLGAARSLKTSQQAAVLASRALEAARDIPYDQLVHSTAGVQSDPLVTGGQSFDPDGAGPVGAEALVAVANAGLEPLVGDERLDGVNFTIRRYVSWFAASPSASGQYKRVTAVVQWKLGPSVRTQYSNTAVSRTRRGLPVPKFEFVPAEAALTAQQGSQVVFSHAVGNQGSPDAFDLTAVAEGRSWAVAFYRDVNGNGDLDSPEDALLTDSDATGAVDTGPVPTGSVFHVLAVWSLSPAEPAGSATVTVTARAASDGVTTATARDTLTVTEQPVYLTLHLHNRPRPPVSDTTAQADLAMDTDVPTATTLYRYSTDTYASNPNGVGGRLVREGDAQPTTTDRGLAGNWVFQLNGRQTLRGSATVVLWVAARDHACAGSAEIRLWLREKTSAATSAGTTLSEATVASDSGTGETCSWRRVSATLPVDATVNANKWLELKVAVPASSASDVVVAYGTTTHDATIAIPQATQ